MFKSNKIKEEFPIFQDQPELIYLDSAATSQKPREVIEVIKDFYTQDNANVHRGVYRLSERATIAYEEARAKVAHFIKAKMPAEIIFCRNATEAINLVAHSWGQANLKPEDEILISQMEHHSNIVPWQMLRSRTGCRLLAVRIRADFTLDLNDLKQKLSSGRVRLLALTHISNVLGTINPIKEISELAHRAGALLLVDGAQAVPHLPVDVQGLGSDFYVFSGHKMLGPTGIGVLYGRGALLEEMPPFLGGGEMIREVAIEETSYNDLPWKFEAGTPSIEGAIGLGAAMDYLNQLSMEKIWQHEKALTQKALKELSQIEGLKIYGPESPENRGGVITFTMENIHAHDIASLLDEENIAVRAGHHCAMPLHREVLKIPATCRASFYLYNSEEDIEKLKRGLEQIKKIMA